MRTTNKILILVACFLMAATVSAQNLQDDIKNNNLEGLKSKVALLSPDFKEFPYIAFYLKNTESYEQATLDYLLAQGASPDQIDEEGAGPLYWAIKTNNLMAVETLIAAKANVNAAWKGDLGIWYFFRKDTNQFSFYADGNVTINDSKDKSVRPLLVALKSNDTDIIKELLKAGADPLAETYKVLDTKKSTKAKTAYLTNTAFDFVVGIFLSAESLEDIDPYFFANMFQLWQAVKAQPKAKQPVLPAAYTKNIFAYFCSGDLKSFKTELTKSSESSLKFLPYAILIENWEIVDLIFKFNQIEIDDAFNENDETLLSWTISNLHTQAAKMLISHGASLPKEITITSGFNSYKYTPLNWATSNGKLELVKALVAAGVNTNDSVPLQYAHKYPEIRAFLLESGADINTSLIYEKEYYYSFKGNLLIDAAFDGSPEAVQFYLDKGLDPNGEGSDLLPLFAAIQSGRIESVKALLSKGANPKAMLKKEYFDFFDYYPNRTPEEVSAKDYATYYSNRNDDPIQKSRYNAIVKLLDKAMNTAE